MPSQLHEALKLLFELDEHFLLDLLPGAGISVEGLVIEGTLPTSVSVPELASDACLRLPRKTAHVSLAPTSTPFRIGSYGPSPRRASKTLSPDSPALENLMMHGFKPQSDFAKKYWEQGRDNGLELGREEGRQEGRQALGEALRASLAARGLQPSAQDSERIARADIATLQDWLLRSFTATRIDDTLC